MNKQYKYVCESYPQLSRVIRNSLLSTVTNSTHKKLDRKEVMNALKKFKKKKRLKVIELFMEILSDTKEMTDVIPNVIRFFDDVTNLK